MRLALALVLALSACSGSLTSPGPDAPPNPHEIVRCPDGQPCELACSTGAIASLWCAPKQCQALEWNGQLGCCENLDGALRFEVCR